jgi:hypothetical protein
MKKLISAVCIVVYKTGQFLGRVLRYILEQTQEHAMGDTFEGSFDWLIRQLPVKNRNKAGENKSQKRQL